MPDVHYGAVLLSAGSVFVVGGLWYSPTGFLPLWMKESKSKAQEGHSIRVFGLAFLCALLSAFALAWLLGPEPELGRAVLMGLGVGVAFVAASFGINYSFSAHTLKHFLIDAGYQIVQFTIYGVILGLWK